jgi:hypothetical protein
MKQTAVEWLVEQINQHHGYIGKAMIDQAKQMEKQQMIEMHDKGFDSVEQLNDEFAIEFAEWLLKKYDGVKSVKELLEIYKKQKGL